MPLANAFAFGFTEHMAGTYTPRTPRLPGGAFAFTFDVDCPDLRSPVREIVGRALGTVVMAGLADGNPAEGTLSLSPFWLRRIRYTFDFTGNDGLRYRFDGRKTINWLHAVASWTTLPGTVASLESGATVADVMTTFNLQTDFMKLATSFRKARA